MRVIFSVVVFFIATHVFSQLPAVMDMLSDSHHTTFYGANTSDYLASNTAFTSGDVNGDGIKDVIVGAPGADGPAEARSSCGEVYVFLGNENMPLNLDAAGASGQAPDLVIYGRNSYSMPTSLGTGDINGDGYEDILIGCTSAANPSYFENGEVYIVLGGPTISGTRDFQNSDYDVHIIGESSKHLGKTVNAIDLNSDGIRDLVVTANNNNGVLYALYGRTSWAKEISLQSTSADIKMDNDWGILGIPSNAVFPDLNADGQPDLVITAWSAEGPSNSRARAGEIYIFFGKPNFDSVYHLQQATADVTIYGVDAYDNLGINGYSVGDFDGDGIEDLVADAPFADGPTNSASYTGEVYVIRGRTSWPATMDLALSPTQVSIIYGVETDDGLALPSNMRQGDFSGDGKDDLLLSGGNSSGTGYLLKAPSSSVINLAQIYADYEFYGVDANDFTGMAACFVDLNGDGRQDAMLSAPGGDGLSNTRTNGGEIYVNYSSTALPKRFYYSGNGEDIHILAARNADRLGYYQEQMLADYNRDGLNDLFLVATGAGPGGSRASCGELYCIPAFRSSLGATTAHYSHSGKNLSYSVPSSCLSITYESGSWGSTSVSFVPNLTYLNIGPPNIVLPYQWHLSTTKTNLQAKLIFSYRDQDLNGLAEDNLRIFQADTASGPFLPLNTTIDEQRNTLSANVISLSYFAIADASVPVTLNSFEVD